MLWFTFAETVFMFQLFGRKERKITDKIWLHEKAKWDYCRQQHQKAQNTAFIVWFEETYEKLTSVFTANGLQTDNIFLARQAAHYQVQNMPVIFAEHYPLHAKEEEFLEKFHLTSVTFCSSLDEPLLKHFGSDKIVTFIQQLGIKENEPLEHKMISSAIKNAQDKVASKVTLEQMAKSQADWLMRNFTA